MKILASAVLLAATQAIQLVDDAEVLSLYLAESANTEGETDDTMSLYN